MSSGTRLSMHALSLAAAAVFAAPAGAAIVSETSFDTTAVEGQTVTMDKSPATATGVWTLKGATDDTYVNEVDGTASTGLGAGWASHLQAGTYQVGYRSGVGDPRDLMGLQSNDEGEDYLNGGVRAAGFHAGTAYFVVSPDTDWSGSNRTLLGTGNTQNGSGARLQLYTTGSSGLSLEARNNVDSNPDVSGTQAPTARTTVTQTWDPEKWYFVAASWETGEEPVLFVREMADGGADASPAGLTGTLATGGNYQSTVPEGAHNGPFVRPIAIGAHYYNPGGGPGTVYGSEATYAYFRLDTGYSSVDDMNSVFQSLQIPEPTSMTLLGGAGLLMLRRRRDGRGHA